MLHGEIKANGHEIARWTAQNIGPVVGNEDFTLYLCNLEYTTNAGYPLVATDYEVMHRAGQGALVLAGNVVQAGKHYLRPRYADV